LVSDEGGRVGRGESLAGTHTPTRTMSCSTSHAADGRVWRREAPERVAARHLARARARRETREGRARRAARTARARCRADEHYPELFVSRHCEKGWRAARERTWSETLGCVCSMTCWNLCPNFMARG